MKSLARAIGIILLVVPLVSICPASPGSETARRWSYAQLTNNRRLSIWELEWDRPAIVQQLSSPEDADKLLRALGGQPSPGAAQFGSGWFPLLNAMGNLGWELVAVSQGDDGSTVYIFKKEI